MSGLFPCAPIAPTLAVSVSLLELVRELFLRVAPNVTGWCSALESVLRKKGYKLTGEVGVFWYCRLETVVDFF
jgi:hypothetical protein